MRFMHELEKLVNDGFQELPVCFKEARVLTNDVPRMMDHIK